MLEGLADSEALATTNAGVVGAKILETLNLPYLLGTLPYRSTSSIGLALFAGKDDSVDEALRQADHAMYQAKAAGRNAIRVFEGNEQAA